MESALRIINLFIWKMPGQNLQFYPVHFIKFRHDANNDGAVQFCINLKYQNFILLQLGFLHK